MMRLMLLKQSNRYKPYMLSHRQFIFLLGFFLCAQLWGLGLHAEQIDWTMPAGNYASTRFSDLQQINTSNVKEMKVAWTFSNGVPRGQEGAPIVVNNTMYIVTP